MAAKKKVDFNDLDEILKRLSRFKKDTETILSKGCDKSVYKNYESLNQCIHGTINLLHKVSDDNKSR